METRVEQHEDVADLVTAAVDVVSDGQPLEGERGDPAPHVEGPADRLGAALGPQLVVSVLDAGMKRLRRSEVELEMVCGTAGSCFSDL